MLWSFFKFNIILIHRQTGKKYWKYNVRFVFTEKSDYSEENTRGNEDFCPAIFQPFQFESQQRKTCGNENYEKETKHIYASAAYLLHTSRIRNFCKCAHCNNEARKIGCLCRRKIEVLFIYFLFIDIILSRYSKNS